MDRIKFVLDLSSRSYSFAFASKEKGLFSDADLHENCESYVQNLCGEAVDFTTFEQGHPSGITLDNLMRDFHLCFHLPLALPCVDPMTLRYLFPLRFGRRRIIVRRQRGRIVARH